MTTKVIRAVNHIATTRRSWRQQSLSVDIAIRKRPKIGYFLHAAGAVRRRIFLTLVAMRRKNHAGAFCARCATIL
jgi:hypothetical protein